MEATLSSKGQATIPKAVRERLHLKPGDRFKFFFHPDGVIILPKIPTARLKGIIPKTARPMSREEITATVEAGATQRFRHQKWSGSIRAFYCAIWCKTIPFNLHARPK